MEDKTPIVGRTITYGLIGLIAAVCFAAIEFWPLTSVHLFTGIRGPESSATELIVVLDSEHDSERIRVHFGDRGEVLSRTSHLYRTVPSQHPERQAAMIEAWLDLARIDKRDVASVRLESVRRELDDDSATWHETGREIAWEMHLQ